MEQLISFFKESNDIFYVVDEQYKLAYGNATYFSFVEAHYGRPIERGEVVLNLEHIGSENYRNWKSYFDVAFQTGSFNIYVETRNAQINQRFQFEFKQVNSFIPFVCVRGIPINEKKGQIVKATEDEIKERFVIEIDMDGYIHFISELLWKMLGYDPSMNNQMLFLDWIHPSDKAATLKRFTQKEYIEGHWCRIKLGNGKFAWCQLSNSTEKQQTGPSLRMYVSNLRLQHSPHDAFVPDVNLLEVIAESQNLYIVYNSLEKAFQPCLAYLHGLGLATFSFLAVLDWKGLQPVLSVPVSYGSQQQFTGNINQLLQYLSFLCSDVQRNLNNGHIEQAFSGYSTSFMGNSFMVYNIIAHNKLLGVWVISSQQQKEILSLQGQLITHFRTVITPILNANRSIDNTNSIIQNLSASKDELLSLVASLDDVVFEVNQSYEFVHVWCNIDALLPKSRDQMIGKNLAQVYPREQAETFEKVISHVISTCKSESIDFDTVQNNVKKWFRAHFNYVKIFSGEIRVSVLIRDITESKLAEVAVANAFAKEKEFNEMKSRMIQSVSHEFRTPLATVSSSTELLEMYIKKNYGIINERAADLFSTIYDEIERLSDMLRNFLVMGRFEENQTPFRPKVLDVQTLIGRIIRTRFHIKFGEWKVIYSTSNQMQQAEIDESLFWHIITNIISNAIKYSPEKEPVFVHLDFKEVGFLVSIEDRGIGIPEKDLPNIFQSFFRAGNSEDHNGYGLGLSIVERFVKMHKGIIDVKSKVGQGTTFSIFFRYHIN